jgi:hypothetical protein
MRRGQRWYVSLMLGFILGWAVDIQSQSRVPTEKVHEMEPVVVTATVAPTSLGRTTAPVTVISREQIEAQQVESVTGFAPGAGYILTGQPWWHELGVSARQRSKFHGRDDRRDQAQ